MAMPGASPSPSPPDTPDTPDTPAPPAAQPAREPPPAPAGRPGHIHRLLREVGPAWQDDIRRHGDRVKAAYLPLQAAGPRQGVTRHADIPYGKLPRQVLDVYAPRLARQAPVLVFVHGGAFLRGAKDINPEMYGNVALWFANQGWVAVNMEYRLAPEAPFPAGADDVALACGWVAAHIERYGGDPGRVGLMGHSAGGTHAASYAFDPTLGHLARHVAALVLVSARLRADRLPENPNAAGVRAYFGDGPADDDPRSPVHHGGHARVPVFIVVAEYENPLLDLYGLEMALGIARRQRRAPRILTVPDHNHVSVMAHFNTGESRLGEAILAFLGQAMAGPAG